MCRHLLHSITSYNITSDQEALAADDRLQPHSPQEVQPEARPAEYEKEEDHGVLWATSADFLRLAPLGDWLRVSAHRALPVAIQVSVVRVALNT